ncbi:MAG: hypothetical protein MUF48_18035 [Pirellulaceae bacterium]|jgi:hypothetical protein|nr:hypothetical protein [Pirellulaceae bacterium]
MTRSTFLERQLAMGGIAADPSHHVPATLCCCRPSVLHFGDAAAEFDAANTHAAVFDVSDRRQLEFTGRDRQSFLHGFCTNDVKRLPPGSGCEAFVTNVKGRILAHVLVFVEDAAIWLDAGPGADDAALVQHFDRYVLREDVQIHSRTADVGVLLLAGPASGRLLATACPAAPALEPLQHAHGTWGDVRFAARRVDILGTRGYLLATQHAFLHALWDDLASAGAHPAGAEVFHAQRIAAGFPLCGIDVSVDNLAQEAARTAQAVSFTKGCYLGQEPIARIDALGHVNRVLCRLHVASGTPPAPGDDVEDLQGQRVGSITSAARVPGTDTSVALGMLRSMHTRDGTPVVVRHGPVALAARVC